MGNAIYNNQDDDGFEVLPLPYSLDHIFSTGLIVLVVPVLINNLINFIDILLPSIELGNPVIYLLSLPLEVLVHENVRGFLKEEMEYDQHQNEGDDLEKDDEVEPVHLEDVEKAQDDGDDSTKKLLKMSTRCC